MDSEFGLIEQLIQSCSAKVSMISVQVIAQFTHFRALKIERQCQDEVRLQF